jgi:hypothetical protein
MSNTHDPDRLIRAYLDEGVTELPDRVFDDVRAEIDRTRQRVAFGPWNGDNMNSTARFALAAAAVVIVAVIGLRFLPGAGPGPGTSISPTAQPTPAATPTAVPTVAPTVSASLTADPQGRLQPGTYLAHPFDTLLGMDARAFTFTTPSGNWEALGDSGHTSAVAWNTGSGDSGGVGVGFLKVHSLNGDACKWSGNDDDIAVGSTVDDLLEALAGSTTVAGGDDAYDEHVANVDGQGLELTMPATLAQDDVGCDETDYRIWNAEGFDIYAQGPSNIWRLGIFNVGSERYVVMASYMPDTPDEVRDEIMAIFRSVVIDSAAGCPQSSTSCN